MERDLLKQRDRKIGLAKPSSKVSGPESLRHWISSLRVINEGTSRGYKVQRSVSLTIVSLWVAGLLCGWLLANAVLNYDGSQPVNIFSVLIVLVASQLFTLILLLVFLLGGFSGIIQTLSMFNPAALWLGLVEKINGRLVTGFSDFFALINHHGAVKLRQYLLIYLAQHFTVALNVGILAALLYLVTVSDMAFGWNTTLTVESSTMYRWFHALSLPWNQFLPAAVPTEELVETSRYYRLQGQLRSSEWHPDQLGTWWLYILMAVTVYGLLPRLIAMVISGGRYDKAISSEIGKTSGVHQVVARMNSPLISTGSEAREVHHDPNLQPVIRPRQYGSGLSCLIIGWSLESRPRSIAAPSKLAATGITAEKYFTAGGNQSLSDDRDIMGYVAAHQPEGVAVVVKAWEPPTLDLMDFIEGLRDQLPPLCPIIVLLSGMQDSPVTADHLDSWEFAVSGLNDPALYIEAL